MHLIYKYIFEHDMPFFTNVNDFVPPAAQKAYYHNYNIY